MRIRAVFITLAVLLTCVSAAVQAASPAARAKTASDGPSRDIRAMAIAQAQIWAPTNIAGLDIMSGPDDRRGFPFRADVHCDYTNKKMSGQSPKFSCVIAPDDTVKVKFGGTNGEVYGEVLATRLWWALGFGADHMYSVRVTCRKCPVTLLEIGDAGDRSAIKGSGGELIFDPAAIERKMAGNDLGLTFGRSNTSNCNSIGGVNLTEWMRTPIWKEPKDWRSVSATCQNRRPVRSAIR